MPPALAEGCTFLPAPRRPSRNSPRAPSPPAAAAPGGTASSSRRTPREKLRGTPPAPGSGARRVGSEGAALGGRLGRQHGRQGV